MTSYAIRSLDRTGTIALSRSMLCHDDLDALSEAERFAEAHAIEIWQGPRLVARIKLGNAPLATEDSSSL